MFKTLKCRVKGHLYVDSRSQPGTQVCVRCRKRQPFEGIQPPVTDQPGSDGSGRVLTPNG